MDLQTATTIRDEFVEKRDRVASICRDLSEKEETLKGQLPRLERDFPNLIAKYMAAPVFLDTKMR